MIHPHAPVGTLAIAVLCFTCLSANATENERLQRLLRGEVLVNEKKRKEFPIAGVYAEGVIDAPMETIWPLIDQCSQYTQTMQRIERSKEISRKGNRVLCEITVELPFPLSNLTATTRAIHTVQPGEMYKRAWKLVKGDYDYNEGSWTLTPFEGSKERTLVRYETQVAPKGLIPDSIRKMAQKKAIPDLFNHLRSQVR